MWVVLAWAGCVGPYPDPEPKGCTAPTAPTEVTSAFESQYCDQQAQCSPDATCAPPDLAATGGCVVDEQAAHDCLCGSWSCDAGAVVYPPACNWVCPAS